MEKKISKTREVSDSSQFYTWSQKAGLDPRYFSKHGSSFYFHKENEPRSAVLNWRDARVKMAIFVSFSCDV